MRTAWLTGPEELSFTDVDLPDPGADEVLIDVLACGVCGSNLPGWRQGPAAGGGQIPGAMGHEIAARVVAVGSGVRSVAPGQAVVVNPSGARSCGGCSSCRRGAPWFCSRPRPLATFGFAEQMLVPDYSLLTVPAGLDPVAAALAEPVACGVHAVRHSWTASATGRVDGRAVAVIGAGVLGLGSVLAARELGAESVVVVARHEHQARAAVELGADHVYLDQDDATPDVVRRLRPALVVEAAGGATTLELAARVAAWQGEVAVLGHFDAPQLVDTSRASARELRIFFPVGYAARDGVTDMAIALDILDKKAAATSMLTHRFALDDITAAFRAASDKTSGALRVAVTP